MVPRALLLAFLLPVVGRAVKVGDTYEQVLAEKGQPTGQAEAGEARILNYPDASLRLRKNIVVEIKPLAEMPRAGLRVNLPPEPRPPTAATSERGAAEWTTDYAASLEQAKTENKQVFLLFTGSDWCGFCIKLEKEVLSRSEFLAYARKRFVLVKLDFPTQRVPQPAEERIRNGRLAAQYGIKGYPTVIILSPLGAKIAEVVGYPGGGPERYLARLQTAAR